jgi:hypothetical protein
VGRLIAAVLFIALLVPGVLLARAWALAAGRRAVAAAAVAFAEPTAEGTTALRRQAQHSRRVRRLGFLLGVLGVAGSVVLFGGASVFLWVPSIAVGLLLGVLLAEISAPGPRWRLSSPARRPRRSEQISPALLWSMRAVVVGEVVTAAVLLGDEDVTGTIAGVALVPPLLAWLMAEATLLRALARPLAAQGADIPVDEALRTWSVHLVTAATSVLALLPLGVLLLVAGIGLGDRVTSGFDLLPVALVAAGFAGITAGLAVAVLLVPWLRPIPLGARALAG